MLALVLEALAPLRVKIIMQTNKTIFHTYTYMAGRIGFKSSKRVGDVVLGVVVLAWFGWVG